MPNPITDFLRVLKLEGWTIAEVAKKIKYSREHLTRVKKEKQPNIKLLYALEKAFPDIARKVTKKTQPEITAMSNEEFLVQSTVLIRAQGNFIISLLAEILSELRSGQPGAVPKEKLLAEFRKGLAIEYQKERESQSIFEG